MNYPLISEYVEAIKLAEENLDQLSYLRPVLNDEGRPVMSSGNFAVVFKMKDERNGKFHALKCFIKDQEGRDEAYKLIADELEYVSSDFITPIKYLEKELFVDTNNSDVSDFPVLLMDWVEGVTLDKYIREHLHDQYALHLITFQFCRLASWLMAQPFAHGDLKPDNILVKEDGSLVLVDYDGLFVPAMKGQKAREIGSSDYRHPLRTSDDFNEHIDDFSLATIAMQLYAIALKPDLFTATYGDTLLLTEADYRALSKCQVMSNLLTLVSDTEFAKLLGLFFMAFSENTLSNISFRAFNINKPSKQTTAKQLSTEESRKDNASRTIVKLRKRKSINEKIQSLFEDGIVLNIFDELLSTKASNDEIATGVKDEFGAIYSADGKKLLCGPKQSLTTYNIKPGTQIICDDSFSIGDASNREDDYCSLTNISIPDSLTHIGDEAFLNCTNLKSIILPDSVTYIGKGAFRGCYNLSHITIPNAVTNIGDKAFYGCSGLNRIQVSNNNKVYDSRENCNAIIHTVNNTLILGCSKTVIPDSVITIGNGAFSECSGLANITIPNSVTHIGDHAFLKCKRLMKITIPNSVTYIGDWAFSYCYRMTSITIPDSVIHIGDAAFYWCNGLTNITIPCSITSIGNRTFKHCERLTSIVIPYGVINIGNEAFSYCKHLTNIVIPGSAIHIGDGAFSECSGLTNITIPDSVTHIGNSAFFSCWKLNKVTIHGSVTHIGVHTFFGCNTLAEIHIPAGSYDKYKELLPNFKDILVEPPF